MQDISNHIWNSKYCAKTDATIEDTWRRIAHALSAVEQRDRKYWEQQFYHAL